MVNYGKPCNEPSEGLAVAIRSKFGRLSHNSIIIVLTRFPWRGGPFRDRYLCLQQLRCLGLVGTVAAAGRRSNQIPFCGERCGQLRGPCSNYSLNSIKYIMRLTDRRRRYGIPLRFSGGHSNATNSLERSQVMSTQIMRKFPHNEHKHSGQEGPGRRRGDRVLNK